MAKTGGIEATKLKQYIERIERLEEEKAALASDVRDLYAEAKGNGFDVKTMREIIKLRKQNANDRTEAEYMLDLYKRALGLSVEYDEDEEPTEGASELSPEPTDEELYLKAKDIVVTDRRASTSYLQRALKLGYNQAASLVERLEKEGVVGPANHVGKREVLVEKPEE